MLYKSSAEAVFISTVSQNNKEDYLSGFVRVWKESGVREKTIKTLNIKSNISKDPTKSSLSICGSLGGHSVILWTTFDSFAILLGEEFWTALDFEQIFQFFLRGSVDNWWSIIHWYLTVLAVTCVIWDDFLSQENEWVSISVVGFQTQWIP